MWVMIFKWSPFTFSIQKLFVLVILWNVTTGKSLVQYKGHNYSVWDVAMSPRDVHFASASFDRTMRLWDMEHAYPLRILAGHYHSVDVSSICLNLLVP